MARIRNKKPLQKYQGGGNTNDPWGFPTSGLANPYANDINLALGSLSITDPNQKYMDYGPLGAQIGESAKKTAGQLNPLFEQMTKPLTQKEATDKLIKERGFVKSGGNWVDSSGAQYSEREFVSLQDSYLAQENKKRAESSKMIPIATPLIMLNELGEAQKTSYNLAQKEGFYDVTKSPLGMESKGFFAKEGMRTPAITEVYRMMGADTGLPTSTTKITAILYPKKQQEGGLSSLLDNLLYGEGDNVETFEQGGETNSINYKDINNMYNNNQRVSRLAMMLGGGLIRGYQDGGMQQPMSQEEAAMMEQAMMEQQAMQQQQMPQQQQQMPQQQQPMPQEGQEQEQEGMGGENKYLQLPKEQQLEVYKQILDFVVENGIDALEQQYPEEYQFFEEYSDMLEGEEDEAEMEGEGEEMEMRGGEEEMPSEEEIMMMEQQAQAEYPTDEEEVSLGARPGENSGRPPMQPQQMQQGGIPERYKKMGFSRVGEKKKSSRSDRKWMVLAKKGNQYKVVHGGDPKMDDFTQHGSSKRKEAFWNRHGGKDSAKANDPFSPMYYHKRGFKNAKATW